MEARLLRDALAFEVTREWAVVAQNEPIGIGAGPYVGRMQNLVSAQGRWRRIDDGVSPLGINGVTIQCWQNEGKCYEATVMAWDRFVSNPDISSYDAKFTDEAVTYTNDDPSCATYSVRIDLKLKKVFGTRERKIKTADPNCANLEPRVEMVLGTGYDSPNATRHHFLPLLWMLRAFLGIELNSTAAVRVRCQLPRCRSTEQLRTGLSPNCARIVPANPA